MNDFDDSETALKALHRMVVYVRNEAARLRVADAALLLGYAEDAIMLRDRERSEEPAHDNQRRGPVVQH